MSHKLFHEMSQLLVPPGSGVHTVSTGASLKLDIQEKIFGTRDESIIKEKFFHHLEKTLQETTPAKPFVLGICSDNGGGILRGANWGPLFLRTIVEKESAFIDLGDVRVIPHLLLDEYLNEKTIKKCQEALYGSSPLRHSLPVSPLSIAYHVANNLHQKWPCPKIMTLGGDHSVSYPVVKSYLEAKKSQEKTCAILHFDAHTDLLSHRLGIDVCFGSWAFHMIEHLKSPELLIQIGLRASGFDRNHWENKLGVKQFWANEVRQNGTQAVAQEIKKILSKHHVDEVYVSFDIDALDAEYALSTGTPELQGLYPHEVLNLLREILPGVPLTGADMVELAPYSRPPLQDYIMPPTPQPQSTLIAIEGILNFLIQEMAVEK
jgi:agmatinase